MRRALIFLAAFGIAANAPQPGTATTRNHPEMRPEAEAALAAVMAANLAARLGQLSDEWMRRSTQGNWQAGRGYAQPPRDPAPVPPRTGTPRLPF